MRRARWAARRRRWAVLAPGAFGLACALAPAALGGPPRLIWNVTASAPLGLYRVTTDRAPVVGEWAAVTPPPHLAAWLAARGYAPRGVLLIKQVAAMAPQQVCRVGAQIRIDGAPVACALERDHAGRRLPRWRGCRRLAADEVFLLNTDPQSLDSRYFGPLPASAVVGQVRAIWTQQGARDGR